MRSQEARNVTAFSAALLTRQEEPPTNEDKVQNLRVLPSHFKAVCTLATNLSTKGGQALRSKPNMSKKRGFKPVASTELLIKCTQGKGLDIPKGMQIN